MPMDEQEEKNESVINAYDHYLNAMTPLQLFDYFTNMDKKYLVECIKLVYGNDGNNDCTFDHCENVPVSRSVYCLCNLLLTKNYDL